MQDKVKGAAFVVLAGAVLALIGVLTTWIKVDTGFGSLTRSGLDYSGDAKIILILMIVAGLAGVGQLTGWAIPYLRPAVALDGLICTVLAIYDYTQVKDKVDSAAGEDFLATVGTGVYLTIAGSVLVLLGGLALRSALKPAATAPQKESVDA